MSDDSRVPGRGVSLWRRWTGEEGPFYGACAVWPLDDFHEPGGRGSTAGGSGDDDRAEAAAGGSGDGDAAGGSSGGGGEPRVDRPPLRFADGWLRISLRHAPVLLLVLAVVSTVGEQLGSYYSPIGTYLPVGRVVGAVDPLVAPLALLGVLWLAGLVRLFLDAGEPHDGTAHRAVVFYGTVAVLLAGVGFSLYLVWFDRLSDPRQHLTFRAGYFLFLLLEAHLVYDGLCLRSETLFWRLDGDSLTTDGYDDFRRSLRDALGDDLSVGPLRIAGRTVGPVSVSRSTAFAVLLLAPTIPLPILSIGVPSPPEAASYTVTVLLQFALIAGLFQFGVLVWYFGRLLSSTHLEYQPFHPDERGGFRDLGRFATRVNAILVVGGGYVLFRFYTGGLRTLPEGGFPTTVDLLGWATSFVGPIVIYTIVVVAWLYVSFWRIHRRMKRGREEKIEKFQRQKRREADGDADGPREDVELDWPVYEALQSAPVWPISRGSVVGIVAIDLIPMLLGTFA